MRGRRYAAIAALCGWVAVPGAIPAEPAAVPAPVRFLLTFDDGPYGQARDNPTVSILGTLADNPVQPGIKAVFFLQTRSGDGGATPLGRELIGREHEEGHLLALHDGSSWGHRSHRNLSDAELETTLTDGVADLTAHAGRAPTLLRPPYWAYDERTLAAYDRHKLAVLMTDITANDGKDWGFKASPRRRIHFELEMARVRERIAAGHIQPVDGVIPVVVTFHDTNTYTAHHMAEYLGLLVELAREAGLPLAAPAFYVTRNDLEAAAHVRASDVSQRREMVPWWWRWMLW